jgi:hypothetical protein
VLDFLTKNCRLQVSMGIAIKQGFTASSPERQVARESGLRVLYPDQPGIAGDRDDQDTVAALVSPSRKCSRSDWSVTIPSEAQFRDDGVAGR